MLPHKKCIKTRTKQGSISSDLLSVIVKYQKTSSGNLHKSFLRLSRHQTSENSYMITHPSLSDPVSSTVGVPAPANLELLPPPVPGHHLVLPPM